MKILLIGNGVIGSGLARRLTGDHEVLVASRSGDLRVDIESRESIRALFARVGAFDALVCAAGQGWLGPFAELDEEKLWTGLRSKLMGQLNLVLEGRKHVAPRGSFTLTSGFLSRVPVWGTTTLGVVNGGIEAFVQHAAGELRPMRINAVSPGAIAETVEKLGLGDRVLVEPVTLERVLSSYTRSILGAESGKIFEAH